MAANSRTSSGKGRTAGTAVKKTASGKKGSSAGTKKNSGRSSARKKKKVKSTAFHEAALYFVLALSLILLISNFGVAGKVGRFFCALQFGTFGVLAYIFPVGLFLGVLLIISRKRYSGVARVKFVTAFAGALFLCGFIEMISGGYKTVEKLSGYYNFVSPAKKGGGIVGGALCKLLTPAFGEVGAYIIIVMFIIAAVVIVSERSILRGLKNGSRRVITSAKDDLNEYREETEKKRVLREEAKEQAAERRRRFDQKVSGVDFSIEIPRENKRTDILGPKPPEAAGIRARREGIAPEEVREVFQNEKYSENIVDIVPEQYEDVQANDEYARDILAGLNRRPAPKKKEKKEEAPSDGFRENENRFAMEPEEESFRDDAVSGVLEEKTTVRTAVKSPSAGAAAVPADTPSKGHTEPEKTMEQVDEEIDQEVRLSEEAAEELEEAYQFPPVELLQRGKSASGTSEKELHDTAMKLQQTLSNFGVRVTVSDVSCGPAVTRYEIQPEQGVKVSRIVSLADDIKLNLAAADIRIEAPIPGKAAVGIEVPNRETSGVCLRELIESREFKEAASPISFGVGKDIAGQVVVADIARMPHVLIAGATGSGKSVCINTIIMSILYRARPSEVKLIMIDPKVVELSVYNGIPHLMIPVVTDSKKAAGALNWAVAEMDDRYKKFAEAGVRDLKGYNAKIEKLKDIQDENKPSKLPQIVIIIDELADLMMVSKSEVEDAIVRLAQLARACGIHLVIATQRPSVDVITGLIKANVPSRIAFAVSSGVDSRTILDMVGAEKLLGKGDMLFSPAGYPKPARVQGAFVSDNEVSEVVEFLKANCAGAGGYHDDVAEKINNPAFGESQAFGGDYDEYFAEAGKYLIEKGKGSIGVLQRVYRIGFNRAARIMDQLADAGVVGPEEGTKPRKVLMTMEEFEEFLEEIK